MEDFHSKTANLRVSWDQYMNFAVLLQKFTQPSTCDKQMRRYASL